MIVYLHPSQQPITPPWLADFEPVEGSEIALCRRETAYGHLVGIGDPTIIDCPPIHAFLDLEEGWKVAVLGKLDAHQIARRPRWCRTEPVISIGGETWRAPVILGEGGERAFLFRYGGRDFLPMLTEEQQRCEAIAKAAREAAPNGLEMGPEACRWAAVLLAAANHISPEAIAELGILDGQLVAETLAVSLSAHGRFVTESEAAE